MYSNNMYYYTVLTLTSNIQQLSLLAFCKELFKEYIIIEEYGKNGDNPHYNIVYQPNSQYWGTNAKRMFSKLYPKDFEITDYLIKTKKATTWQNIVGGYLQKEDQFKIIYNNGIDIESCKTFATTQKELNFQKVNNVYEFVNFKIMPYKPEDKYIDAEDLIKIAYTSLFKLEDTDVVRYYKQNKMILQIVRAKLEQDIKLFTPFD